MTLTSREVLHASLRVQRTDVMTADGPLPGPTRCPCPLRDYPRSVLGARCLWSCEAPIRELLRSRPVPSLQDSSNQGPTPSDPITAMGVALVHL